LVFAFDFASVSVPQNAFAGDFCSGIDAELHLDGVRETDEERATTGRPYNKKANKSLK